MVCVICCFCGIVNVQAANHVQEIKIDAVLNQDGSMTVEQVWSGTFEEGTENFIPMRFGEDKRVNIRDYSVSDQKGKYETVDTWDVSKSLEEKANKAGILVKEDGYDICFGISSYGKNTYTIQYTMDHVMIGYTDVDGMSFKFINDQMNTTPTMAEVTIRLYDGTPLLEEDVQALAHGYDGGVELHDGILRGYVTSALESENYMTILVGLRKGILNPTKQVEESFSAVKDHAYEISNYKAVLLDGDEYESGGFLSAVILMAVVFGGPYACYRLIRRLFGKKRKSYNTGKRGHMYPGNNSGGYSGGGYSGGDSGGDSGGGSR